MHLPGGLAGEVHSKSLYCAVRFSDFKSLESQSADISSLSGMWKRCIWGRKLCFEFTCERQTERKPGDCLSVELPQLRADSVSSRPGGCYAWCEVAQVTGPCPAQTPSCVQTHVHHPASLETHTVSVPSSPTQTLDSGAFLIHRCFI